VARVSCVQCNAELIWLTVELNAELAAVVALINMLAAHS
jgi:hypothetical protein